MNELTFEQMKKEIDSFLENITQEELEEVLLEAGIEVYKTSKMKVELSFTYVSRPPKTFAVNQFDKVSTQYVFFALPLAA